MDADHREEKHKLFMDVEELLRDTQEKLLWWVESRNRAKELMLWALQVSPKNFNPTFELLRDAYKEIEVNLRDLKKIRGLQLSLWRVDDFHIKEIKESISLEGVN